MLLSFCTCVFLLFEVCVLWRLILYRHRCLCHLTYKPYGKSHLQEKYHRHTILEFLVHRLVMPHLHAAPSANASADNAEQEQCCLRYAPLGVLRLVLVNAIGYECHGIDGEEVNEYCCCHTITLHHSTTHG